MSARRGEAENPDLTVTGVPPAVLLALAPSGLEGAVTIEGDRTMLPRLRECAQLPEQLAQEVAAATQLSSVPS